MRRRRTGRSGHIQSSSITTSSPRAATSRHGSSPSTSSPRCERASSRFAEELQMKTMQILTVAGAIAGSGLALCMAQAQQPTTTTRKDLQRHDLSAPGREVVQAIVGFDEGVAAPRHTHPGEEIIYVLEGTLEYSVEGQPLKTLKAGDVLFVPARTIHSARNVGKGHAAELATYIV